MSGTSGPLLATTLSPPADGGRRIVALTAGQTLVIASDDPLPVLLIREGDALDIDFGVGGTICVANGVPAAGLVPVPLIAGRDGPPIPLDRLMALLDRNWTPDASVRTGGVATAALLALPYGRGIAMSALLDRSGLHPGVPAVDGVVPDVPDDLRPEEPAPDICAGLPPAEAAQETVSGPNLADLPAGPEPEPEYEPEPEAAVAGGDLPDMVYGDALLDRRAGERARRAAAIRRRHRWAPEPVEDETP